MMFSCSICLLTWMPEAILWSTQDTVTYHYHMPTGPTVVCIIKHCSKRFSPFCRKTIPIRLEGSPEKWP